MAHTKGPWKANKYKGLGNRDVFIVQQEGGDFFSIADVFTYNDRDNARLIAAAPDLLAACEEAVETLESWHNGFGSYGPCLGCDTCKRIIPQIRRAIAKAKGE